LFLISLELCIFFATLLTQTSKVVLDEPASIGTLSELCRFCLDLVRQIQHEPSFPSTSLPPPTGPFRPFSAERSTETAVYTFEATLLLAVSQMALARYKTIVADRTRRHISSDLSTEWLDLIKKASSVLPSVKGKGVGAAGAGPGGTKAEVKGLLAIVKAFIETRLKVN
jgi:hypothetical protein